MRADLVVKPLICGTAATTRSKTTSCMFAKLHPRCKKLACLPARGMPSVLQAASVFVSIGAPVSRRVVEGQDASFVFERYYRFVRSSLEIIAFAL